ncbi:hypothetical protein Hdeb2414_s0013g00415891 [Helianthus debilis subsp. tardiflorus]
MNPTKEQLIKAKTGSEQWIQHKHCCIPTFPLKVVLITDYLHPLILTTTVALQQLIKPKD